MKIVLICPVHAMVTLKEVVEERSGKMEVHHSLIVQGLKPKLGTRNAVNGKMKDVVRLPHQIVSISFGSYN